MGRRAEAPEAETPNRPARSPGSPGPTDPPFIALYSLLAAALVVTAVSGGLVWPNNAPSNAPLGGFVHVTAVDWSVEGCDLGPYVASGTNAPASGSFSVAVTLGNASIVRTCTFLSVEAETPGFSVIHRSMALTLPYDELTELSATISGPAGFWSGTLNLTVVAETSG